MVNIVSSTIASLSKIGTSEAGNEPKKNTLAVNDKTTIKDLQDFLAGAKTTDNVRGHMVNGSLVLYTKSDPTGKGSKLLSSISHSLSDSASLKRGLGKSGIEQIFDQNRLGTTKTMTSNIKTALDQGFRSSVKVGSMVVLAEIASMRNVDKQKVNNAGPSLSTLGMSKEQLDNSMSAATKLFNAGDFDGGVKLLGKDFAEAFEKKNPDGKARDEFSLSLGETFTKEIGELLVKNGAAFPPPSPQAITVPLAEKIYAAVGSQVGRAKFNDAGELVIGSQTYAKAGLLGAGGNGSVDLYVNKRDPSDRLAFKIGGGVNQGRADLQLGMLTEIENHRKAYAKDPDNVVPMRAGVQMPDGQFGLAMDVAPLGDLASAIKNLDAAERKGDINPMQSMAAKLTLLQDGLKGLQIMHDSGTAHRDLKPENLFIFGGGVAKIADMGDGRTIANYDVLDGSGMSAAYVSHEVFNAGRTGMTAGESMSNMNFSTLRDQMLQGLAPEHQDKIKSIFVKGESPMRVAARELLTTQMPNLSSKQIEDLLGNLKDAVKKNIATDSAAPVKRDAFAMGVTAFQLATGAVPTEGWDAKPSAVLSQDSELKIQPSGLLDPALKKTAEFLVKMTDELTDRDANNRIEISKALESQAFELAGVGTPETRKLIDTVLRGAKNLGEDYLPLSTLPPLPPTPAPVANQGGVAQAMKDI